MAATGRPTKEELTKAGQLMWRESWRVRLKVQGIERIREIARENGKLGGRPPKR